ncbi:hypothetical protein [Streptomyces sp. NRRL B-24484]|uniref:hypothetical protein n=1 Tax=Streptomyces sp. NRRL B-24484 TaxID=1463833 RepID=UPI0004BE98DC|nr:hypothetical protein [Streptomyces sp. NRRL B-24484]
MTTPSPRRPRRPRRRPASPSAAVPTAPACGERLPAPGRVAVARACCRTWSSERISQGGTVVRTTWHEPACRSWGRG